MGDPDRVRMTADRLELWPPCPCQAVIVLAREVTDLQLIQQVACPACARAYRVTFSSDHRQGVRVTWQPLRATP